MPVGCHFDIFLHGFYIRSVYLKLFFVIFVVDIVYCSPETTNSVTRLVFLLLVLRLFYLRYYCLHIMLLNISAELLSEEFFSESHITK